MRILCPFCGDRDHSEFSYLGDATVARPAEDAPDRRAKAFEALYVRENPAGPHEELWYHQGGCRSWLRVHRDTRTHQILSVMLAKGNTHS